MTHGARQTWRAVAATAGACLLVTLVGWAALIGPSPVLTGPGPMMGSATTSTTEPPDEELEEAGPSDTRRDEPGAASRIIGKVIAGIILAVCSLAAGLLVLLVWRRVLTAWHLRRRYEPPPSVDFDTLEPGHPEHVRRAMATDADEQLRLLLEGQPRNAIVACWHRFEVQAVEAGLVRHPWETASEFALRLLDEADVAPDAVARLLELYREARFSAHELHEADREIAATALRQIQGQVARR